MNSALLYLQYHTIKNRTVMRIKRLKQPKYLFGAVVGGPDIVRHSRHRHCWTNDSGYRHCSRR